jgi:Fic family protein
LLFEELPNIEDRVPDVREVANYVRALEFGLESLRHRPLKLGMIRELHHVLMTGVRGGDKTPGALRNIQVFIGPTMNMADARFVPPPPLHVPTALEALENFIETPSTLPPLIRIALVHYQFEAIHPFQDGNGRIGRLLITLMLAADRLLPQPMFYLSAYFEKRRADYYRHLLEVSQKGAWTEWLSFFLKGVTDQANDSLYRVTRLLQLRHKYRAKLLHARSSLLTLKLIDELFSNPVITAARASTALDVSATSAKSHIDRLVNAKILKETTGQKRGRVYIAVGVVRSLDTPGGK